MALRVGGRVYEAWRCEHPCGATPLAFVAVLRPAAPIPVYCRASLPSVVPRSFFCSSTAARRPLLHGPATRWEEHCRGGRRRHGLAVAMFGGATEMV